MISNSNAGGPCFNIERGTYILENGEPTLLTNHPDVKSYNTFKHDWDLTCGAYVIQVGRLKSVIEGYKGMMSRAQKELSEREVEYPIYKLTSKKSEGAVRMQESMESAYLIAYRQHLQKTPGLQWFEWQSYKDMTEAFLKLEKQYDQLKHENSQLLSYLQILSKLGSLHATFDSHLSYTDRITDDDIRFFEEIFVTENIFTTRVETTTAITETTS